MMEQGIQKRGLIVEFAHVLMYFEGRRRFTDELRVKLFFADHQ